jgi:voltage-gated potassium channel
VDRKQQSIILFGYGKFGRTIYRRLKEDGFGIRVAVMHDNNYEDALADGVIDVRKFNPKKNESLFKLDIEPKRHMLYCTMDHTANNLFLVLSLRELYHDATIVAISNSEESSRKLRFAGADIIINIYDASTEQIINALTRPAVREAINTIVYERNDIKIAEITIEEGSEYDGKELKGINFRIQGVVLIAIIDKEKSDQLTYISRGENHKLDAGDTLVVVGNIEALKKFTKKCKNSKEQENKD